MSYEVVDNTNFKKLPFNLCSIFPYGTTCVLVGIGNSGKSTYIQYILNHLPYFFDNIPAIFIVYCDNQSKFYDEGQINVNIPIYHIQSANFEPENLIQNSILIFEDVSQSNTVIFDCLNIYTHHQKLSATFVVCKSLIESFISVAQKIILFSRYKQTEIHFKAIIKKFFSSETERDYLHNIYRLVESEKEKLILSLFTPYQSISNSIYQFQHPILISHLESLESGGCRAYMNNEQEMEPNQDINLDQIQFDNSFLAKIPNVSEQESSQIPQNTMVMVPLKHILLAKENQASDANSSCEKIEQIAWNNLIEDLYYMVDTICKYDIRNSAKYLIRQIFANKNFCICKDKLFYLARKPDQKRNIFDFVQFALRRKGPKEVLQKKQEIFKEMAKTLMENGTHTSMFTNVLLHEK